MTGTPLSDVYEAFMMLVKDYKLINLYKLSDTHKEFEDYIFGWLKFAVEDFYNCDQSLAYSGGYFVQVLSNKNIDMLVQLIKKRWLEKEIDDITQMHLHISDADFHMYSENQNMIAKQARLILEKEEISAALVKYSLNNFENLAKFV